MNARVYVGLVADNAVILAVGYGLLYALGLARLRVADLRLVALSYLAGWALLGVALSYALIVGIDPRVANVLVVAAVLIGGCVVIGRRVPKLDLFPRRRRWNPPAALVAAFGGGALVLVAVSALIVAAKGEWVPQWDVWGFWIPKAETIYYWHGLDLGVGGYGDQLHPEYPLLVPAMTAMTFHFVGGFHPSLLPFQMTLLGLAFLGGVLALLDRHVPRWVSFPLLALLAVTPGFFVPLQELMADRPLAYVVATAAVACVLWLVDGRRAWLSLALVLLVAATLTKLEGTSLGLVMALAVIGAGLRMYGRAGRLSLVLLLGPAAIEPWRLWLGSHGLPASAVDYHATDLLRPTLLAHRIHRFTYALDYNVHSVFSQALWLTVLPLALAALVVAVWRLPAIAVAVAAWMVVGLLGLTVVYWIGQPGIVYYVHTSADRIVATIVIVAGTLTPLLLGLALNCRPVGSSEPVRRAWPGPAAEPSTQSAREPTHA